MKLLRYTLTTLVLSSSLALVACGGDPEPSPVADEIAQEDVVDLGDLITQDPDLAAAAEVIGEPATLLAEGRRQGEKARSDVAAVLSFVKQLAADGPVKKGAKADGKAFALWKKTIAGKDASLLLLRVEPGRFRYLVALPMPMARGLRCSRGFS
jgi:hypothetical protein